MTTAKAVLESPINDPLLVDDVAMEPPKRVDLAAHQGLRGLLSLYVMIYHYFWYSTLQWELHGSALMPPFFVLSGFSLAVGYGSKPLAPGSACCGEAGDGDRALDWRAFYRNRAARILPTHYLADPLLDERRQRAAVVPRLRPRVEERARVRQGRKRVIQRRFNVSVPRARVPEKASTRRERSEG
jgi:hypothetical protein